MSSTTPDLIVGTAGHIDHGKSALVQALTGVDPDRLAEEKRRGITIQLGFAKLTLPDGRTMGVVDVPGHEKFVRQMIAGATGVDVALLVIAADDGVMPQTIEHVAVLQTLGIRSCVVALTKTDLVDDDWVELVADEVRAFLATTPYAEAPIVAVSSKTRAGLNELLDALQDVSSHAMKIDHGDTARLPIDRVFSIKGAGTVVTGTLWSGVIAAGDTVVALPLGRKSRVRNVEIHGQAEKVAIAGNRVALNLTDLATDDLAPGDMLVEPGEETTSDRFDCHFTYLDTAKSGKPLLTGVRMHVAHGTKEVLGRVLFCDGREKLAPNESAFAQVRLEEPLAIRLGDRFIVRTYSPVHVAGGGRVLLARPRHRTNLREGERELFDALMQGDLNNAVALAVGLQSFPISAHRLSLYVGVSEKAARHALDSAVEAGRIVALGNDGRNTSYTTPACKQRLSSRIEKALIGFHSAHPSEAGMSLEALRRTCMPQVAGDVFGAIVDDLAQSGAVVSRGGLVGHPSAQGSAQQALDNAADAIHNLLVEQGMSPEPLSSLAEHAGVAPQLAGRAATALVEAGRAYRLSNDLLFDAETVKLAKQRIDTHLASGGAGTVAALRDCMGTTRKFAVPLLERFDAEGFTKRDGDERMLG